MDARHGSFYSVSQLYRYASVLWSACWCFFHRVIYHLTIIMMQSLENGWGLTRAPADLVKELKQSLHDGLPNADIERDIEPIETEQPSWFVHQPALNRKVLQELKPMHEEWSGLELEGAIAYGLRAYRNNSVLFMHIDKMQTHVISCILHVDHSEDSQPWPLFIEDLQGNTNEGM